MATDRGNSSPNNDRGARTENPFLHVPNVAGDLHGYEGSGGGTKEVVPVTSALRETLGQALGQTRAMLAGPMLEYPTLPGSMAFVLHEKGIAKSHRPLYLAQQAGLYLAGHGKLNEMLVAAGAEALSELETIFREGSAKVIKANISAIADVVPWTRKRRNPEGTLSMRESGRAVLRIFKYNSDQLNVNAIDAMQSLLRRLNVQVRRPNNQEDKYTWVLPSLDGVHEEALDLILEHPAVRSLSSIPSAMPVATSGVTSLAVPRLNHHALGVPVAGLPVVGVFDTGVAPGAVAMQGWVASRTVYVAPPYTDYVHGTAVASLIAGGTSMNPGFENHPCIVHDVTGLEVAGTAFDLLEDRVSEAVNARSDIKIWNLSLGSNGPCDAQMFSDFAQTLDRLSDKHNVLFVVASGNYLGVPRRDWPITVDMDADRVSMPGESVRALTVGSITHAASASTLVQTNEPAPYSRRGPGPTHTPKPDVVHFGGNVHAPWSVGPASTQVLRPSGSVEPSFGTSFSAPLVSAVAGHVWNALEQHPALPPNPSLVKALLLHAAQLSSPDYSATDRRYYGAGLPVDAMAALYDRDDSFTLVFEAQVQPGNWRWRKDPFPIPSGLMQDGKFRGEVILTAAYAPPLDSNFGAEYVRANLEVGFGTLDDGAFKGKVPMISEKGAAGFEQALIEHGGKWSPVKIHRKRFPKGVAGDTWALNASLSLRAQNPALREPQKAYIIITLRSLDGDIQIHAQGIRAMRQRNWVHQTLPPRVPVRT